MAGLFTIPPIEHLPRLGAVLADVFRVRRGSAQLDLDLAEALACDDDDRAEVIINTEARFGIGIAEAEVAACESVADLLRLVAAKSIVPPRGSPTAPGPC
jgi:acyl carrier protein